MKIKIKNLTFKCIIGILDFERKKKQKVNINVSFNYIYKENKFIDYSLIVNLIEKSMKKSKYLLIEDAILDLNQKLKNEYTFKKLKISIEKPDILDNCVVSVSNK